MAGVDGGERTHPMRTPIKRAMKTPVIGDRLLTLREAAEVSRLNPRTVRGYVQRAEVSHK